MRRQILFGMCLVVSVVSSAQVPAAPADSAGLHVYPSITSPEEKFQWKQLIVPGALIAVGSFGVSNGWFQSVNHDIRDGMSTLRGDCYFRADDYLQYVPAAGYLAAGFIPGVSALHSFKERLGAGVTAYACMAAITNIVKYAVKEPRPDSSSRNSFPSGHTATAFTVAELMRIEYGPWVGAAGYTVALGVAFLRVYNERHWTNDVIAGAGIGILSAHVGYWLLPLERRWLRSLFKDDMLVTPYADGTNAIGLTLSATF